MHPHASDVDRRKLALQLFTAYDSTFYAVKLAEVFTDRLAKRRRRGPGQRTRRVLPGAIRQWKHQGIIPHFAVASALELLEANDA